MNSSLLRAASFAVTSLGFSLLMALSIVVGPAEVKAVQFGGGCGTPTPALGCLLGAGSCAAPTDKCKLRSFRPRFSDRPKTYCACLWVITVPISAPTY